MWRVCIGQVRTPNRSHPVKPSFGIMFLRCSVINPLPSWSYLSGRVPAADRSSTWSCECTQIWFLLSHGGKYISIAWGMSVTMGTWVISLPYTLLTLPLSLLPHVKRPVSFLLLNSDMSGSSWIMLAGWKQGGEIWKMHFYYSPVTPVGIAVVYLQWFQICKNCISKIVEVVAVKHQKL